MIRRNSLFLDVALPQPTPFGILSPATETVYEDSEDWIAGFEYETSDAAAEVENGSIYGVNPPVSETVVAADTGKPTTRFYYPFDIKTSVKTSTFGNTPESVQESAERKLEIVTQKAIETEFWTGAISKSFGAEHTGNRYLSHEDAVDVTPTAGTAVKVHYGQALLEQALGNATIGSLGVIHAPLLVAGVMQTDETEDGVLQTNLGTKIVAGPGYSNTGPNGAVAPTGQAWLYATGPVTVRLGKASMVTPEEPAQAVNISNNVIEYFIDRPAAVTWSTSNLYAVLVDLTLDYA